MVVYSLIPSTIMAVFDCLLIKTSLINTHERRTKRTGLPTMYMVAAMNKRRRDFTISLLVVTFVFLAMTLPASICYAFFKETLLKNKSGLELLCLFDFIHFLNRSILFPTCFLTNVKFRSAVYKFKSNLTASCNVSCRQRNETLIYKLWFAV